MDLRLKQILERSRLLRDYKCESIPQKKSMVIDRTMIFDMSQEDLDEFTCGICHEIFTDPVVTPCCRQTYCNLCINRWLLEQSLCPNDRKPLYSTGLTPAPIVVVNLLSNLKIKCKYHKNGCQTVLKVSEMEGHLKDCSYSQCETCGLGQESDEEHNCLQNLKITIDSISGENRRLKIENKRLEEENKQLKVEKTTQRSRIGRSRASIASIASWSHTLEDPNVSNTSRVVSNQRAVLSESLKGFMSGKFKLESMHITEGNTRTDVSNFKQTIIEIKISDQNELIMTRTGTFKFTKVFILGQKFEWVRDDGQYRVSVFDYNRKYMNLSGSQFVETIHDQGRPYNYYYDFDILNKSLIIEWSVRGIRKVEIFKKIYK